MKNLALIITFLTFYLNSFGQLKLDIGLDQIGKEDVCQITRASHDSWIDWSINDEYIVYISPQSGNNNLYRIKVADLELTKVQSGFYAASYLLDSLAKNPTEQITFATERTVECPVIVPNSNKVAYRTYYCNESYECLDFDLRIYDFKTKESKTIFKEELYLFDFIDSVRLLYVPHNNDSTIKELNIKTGKTSTFKTFDFKVTALQFDSGKLLINSADGIYSIDLDKKDLEKKYSGKIFATRLAIFDQKLVATLPGPASGIIDLNTNTQTKLFNAYDYEPTLSNDKKFVAVISERALGILIKRVK